MKAISNIVGIILFLFAAIGTVNALTLLVFSWDYCFITMTKMSFLYDNYSWFIPVYGVASIASFPLSLCFLKK